MLSKNNNRELKRKMEEKQDRFTIKKLSVGVASVLLGSFIMGTQTVQTAHASDDNAEDTTVNSAQNTTMEQVVPLTASTSQASDSQATNSAQASTAAQSTASNIASAATSSAKSEAVETNVVSAATNVSSESTKSDPNVLAHDNSQAASATISNRALSSSLILAASTTPSGATQAEQPAPNKGYSVTDATAKYAKSYNANNVPLDPNPAHQTVNSYIVTGGSKNGVGNRYAYSVSEADVNGTGLPTKFYFMKFNSDNTVATTITIPTDVNGGTSYKVDDYAEIVVANTSTGRKQFTLQKLVDDGNWFTPVYSTFDDQVDKGGSVSQVIAIPEWVAETTTYRDESGKKLRDDYVQYGWQGSSYTTRPVDKEGYDVRATPNYVAGDYDLDIPTSQKNGTLVVGTPYHKGDVIRSTRVTTRGTSYSQSTIIDDKGTVEYRAWFTYAKAAGTYSPDSKLDQGRVAADLPPADYDFVTNPNHYTILDPTQMTLNQVDEGNRERAGLAGQIVFQEVRFLYTNPAEHNATGNGNANNNVPKDGDYSNLQKTYNYTILPYETNTWGKYDTGRTLTASNPVTFPSLVNYVYWTQRATITYIDDTTGQILHVDDINGRIGTNSLYRPTSKEFSGNSEIGQDKSRKTKTIGDYEKEGYVLVSNNYPADGAKFTDDNQVQNFEIHFAQGVQPVTPDTPTPDVPKNTPENARPNALKKEVTLTVNYVNADGTEFTGKIPANAKQTITFNGLAYVNKVTGELVNAKQDANGQWIVDKNNTAMPAITWTPDNGSFSAVTSPAERGYHVETVSSNADASGKNVAAINGITKDSNNINITVTYAKNGTKVENAQTVDASQTVKYVDEQGNELSPIKSQTFQFKYSGDTYDAVTNDLISNGLWNATSHDFDVEDVPVINGYVAVKGYTRDDNGKVVAGGFTTTQEASEARRNRTYTVVYAKVGSIVPQDPNGNPIPDPNTPGQNVPNVPYTNDPIDPTKVTPDEPTPIIPGYTPSVNTVTPPDPTKDTPVVYTKNVEEKAKVQYIDLDENNRVMSESSTLTGKAGETINYSTADSIADYEKQGYVLVNDGFSGNPVFDNVDGNEQIFKVTFRHGRIPVGPDTPDKHGVDPNEVAKNVKETVHYVGAGDKTPADNVQTSKWTRTVTVDAVTGNVVADGQYTTDWSIAKGEKSVYDQVDTPIVDGYHADKRQVNATAVTQNDIEVTVTYTPNGKIIPVDPDGNPIPNVPTPQYPTDPTDPTKVTPDEPVPTIPGYTPSVPTVTPTDPGKDTPV
ncbi:YSIRK-type signal peptide-containing protein, partial [Limosilactobacillus reuteri]|uniref:mucin-binding protein n=1 Tax=Limosilactobacillus reuteri TaxID=1598 RepID=UPI001E35892B